MKLLVVSDTHGKHARLSGLLDMHADADALIFLGDGLGDLWRADAYQRGMSVISLKGNCDGFSFFGDDAPTELCQTVGGFKFFMLHGHTRSLKSGFDKAVAAAAAREADVVLFGHTHLALEKYLPEGEDVGGTLLKKPLRLFNPGSLGEKGEFGLIDIRNGQMLMSHGVYK